ncbi:RING-H2 finger protein ATL48-like [Asparagus officinalis]|uniref:RING-H2 finger protein ATL48-like n=1 Tax=Asparagus officinalis TaxID=4686 RepID=UPI00098DEBCB|nr:RING-H2 finger protein ATL48-like [Asparagus officinalis]
MSDSDNCFNANNGLSTNVTGEITVALVIITFFLFIVAFVLYLRVKGYSGTIGFSTPTSHHLNLQKQALDQSIIKSLPVTLFQTKELVECGLECAVCLSKVNDGEKIRFLPKCKHGFHIECIDTWFLSNSTCPLCRNPVNLAEIPVQSLEAVSGTQRTEETQNPVTKVPDLDRLGSLRRSLDSNCVCSDIELGIQKSIPVSESASSL